MPTTTSHKLFILILPSSLTSTLPTKPLSSVESQKHPFTILFLQDHSQRVHLAVTTSMPSILDTRWKLPLHLLYTVLVICAMGLSVPRLFMKNQPRTRANTIALGFVSI